MSSSNSVGDFNLNLVEIRKPLQFPDGTIQDTAYTGNTGVPTLSEVLTAGSNGGGNDISNVDNVSLASITFPDTTVQTTAYTGSTGVPTINQVLVSGSDADGEGATDLGVFVYRNNGVIASAFRVGGAPSTSVPQFEIRTVSVTGNSSPVSGILTLSGNSAGTTNYSVFPSIYYGFSGSGGTYNASGTAGAVQQIVIYGITASQFQWVISKQTSDNVNIILNFLIVYNVIGTNYSKAY